MTATAVENSAEAGSGSTAVGRVSRVIGPVVDIEFPADAMPDIYNALTVEVTMGTVTPDFDTFQVSVDRGPWRKAAATFAWKLNPGANRLEMRVRNKAGVLGRVSHVEIRR